MDQITVAFILSCLCAVHFGAVGVGYASPLQGTELQLRSGNCSNVPLTDAVVYDHVDLPGVLDNVVTHNVSYLFLIIVFTKISLLAFPIVSFNLQFEVFSKFFPDYFLNSTQKIYNHQPGEKKLSKQPITYIRYQIAEKSSMNHLSKKK